MIRGEGGASGALGGEIQQSQRTAGRLTGCHQRGGVVGTLIVAIFRSCPSTSSLLHPIWSRVWSQPGRNGGMGSQMLGEGEANDSSLCRLHWCGHSVRSVDRRRRAAQHTAETAWLRFNLTHHFL